MRKYTKLMIVFLVSYLNIFTAYSLECGWDDVGWSNEKERDFSDLEKCTHLNLDSPWDPGLTPPVITGQSAIKLAAALKNNTSIEILDLTWNDIGADGAIAIAAALKGNHTLVRLNLEANSMGDKGAQAIAKLLMDNDTIEVLHLGNNVLSDEGVQSIAEVLKDNRTLKRLFLTKNPGIGREGVKALAEALKKNDTLEDLYLFFTWFEDEGAKALAEALRENQSLVKLDLTNNDIGDAGAIAIANALADNTNTKLEELSFKWNKIGEGGRAIAEALRENDVLKVLDIRGNQFTDEGIQALDELKKLKGDKITIYR